MDTKTEISEADKKNLLNSYDELNKQAIPFVVYLFFAKGIKSILIYIMIGIISL